MLCIGPIKLETPIVQAALSGYSDWPMRVIARRLGASYTLCEVMLDQFLIAVKNRRRNRHSLHVSDEEHPVGGQLMGADPEQFGPAALRLVDAGFDVIDINFGCPVKKVLGRCRGGFHLGQPDVALEIVRRTRDAVPDEIPVTVKMRRGIDDSNSSRDHFFQILDGVFNLGVAAVTVHGRTVQQRYIGPSNWDFLRDVKQHVGNRTILGSGDLFSAQDCLDMCGKPMSTELPLLGAPLAILGFLPRPKLSLMGVLYRHHHRYMSNVTSSLLISSLPRKFTDPHDAQSQCENSVSNMPPCTPIGKRFGRILHV